MIRIMHLMKGMQEIQVMQTTSKTSKTRNASNTIIESNESASNASNATIMIFFILQCVKPRPALVKPNILYSKATITQQSEVLMLSILIVSVL